MRLGINFNLNRVTMEQFEHAAVSGTTSIQEHGLRREILESDLEFLLRNGTLPRGSLVQVLLNDRHDLLVISTEFLDSSQERNNSSLYRSHLCHIDGPEYKKPAMSKDSRIS